VTPETIRSLMLDGEVVKALAYACRLGEEDVLTEVRVAKLRKDMQRS
jgi:hypothetical protein